jgi:predicted DNA binding CopG/RHH family protein
MAKKSEISNVIKVNSSSVKGLSSSFSDSDNDSVQELKDLYNKYLSAIKIIVISGITEADDFLSDYENYKNILKVIDSYNVDKEAVSIKEFSANPIKAWTNVIVSLAIILRSFPQNQVNVERIEATNTDYNGENKTVDEYYLIKLSVTTEAYDWKEHNIEIMMPSDNDKNRIIVMIDGEVVFCT